MDIAIARWDPASPWGPADDATADALLAVETAALAADHPDRPPPNPLHFTVAWTTPWPGMLQEWVVARRDGVVVAYAELDYPQLDNTDNVTVELYVHPAHRRQGVGRALYGDVVARVRAAGRKRLIGDAVTTWHDAPSPDADADAAAGGRADASGADGGRADANAAAGGRADASGAAGAPAAANRADFARAVPETAADAFARSLGATPALVDVRRRLDLGTVDEPALAGLLAQAWSRADGYTLVQWRGSAPEEYAADVAYLDGRLTTDAPMGDLAWEPEQVDVPRLRGYEAAIAARRRNSYNTGMRHEASGRLVAWSAVTVDEHVRWHCWQQITIVDPPHRGHRLGAVVKIENLGQLRAAEPAVRVIDTFNAAANDHMIAINEAMGFREVDRWMSWQHDI